MKLKKPPVAFLGSHFAVSARNFDEKLARMPDEALALRQRAERQALDVALQAREMPLGVPELQHPGDASRSEDAGCIERGSVVAQMMTTP
jgi:hypothetical protein